MLHPLTCLLSHWCLVISLCMSLLHLPSSCYKASSGISCLPTTSHSCQWVEDIIILLFMLEAQDYFRVLCVGRTNYIICGPQCRMKMPAPCSKIIKNFRKTLNQACVTAQVTHSMSQPCSFCHAPCWMSSIATYFLSKAQNHLFSVTQNFLTTRTQPGMEVVDTQAHGT